MSTQRRVRRSISGAALLIVLLGAVGIDAARFWGRDESALQGSSQARDPSLDTKDPEAGKEVGDASRALASGPGYVASGIRQEPSVAQASWLAQAPQLPPPAAVLPPPRPVYLDPLIDPGIADDPLLTDLSVGEADGRLPGSANIEYRLFNGYTRGGFAVGSYTEQGLGVQFQQETRSFGRFGIQAATVNGSSDGAIARGAESGNFINLAHRDFALTDSLMMDNEVGHVRARAPLLLSQGYRVRLPEPLIEGLFSETRSANASFKVASGTLGTFRGRTFPVFSTDSSSGSATGVAGSALLSPSITAAGQLWQANDVLTSDGISSFTSMAGAIRYDGGNAGKVQANVLGNDNGSLGVWLDGTTRLAGWQHLAGIYHMDPKLDWIDRNSAVLSDTQGVYWQGSTRSFWSTTSLGLDVLQTNVDNNASYPTRDVSSVFGGYTYRVSPDLNISGHLLLGTESASGVSTETNDQSVTARGVVNNRFESGQGTGAGSFSERSGASLSQRLDLNWDYLWNPVGNFSGLRTGVAHVRESGSLNGFNETSMRFAGTWGYDRINAGAGANFGYLSGASTKSSQSASVILSLGWLIAPGWQLAGNVAYNQNALQFIGQTETRVSDRQMFVSLRYGAGWGRPEYAFGATNGNYGRGAIRGVLFLDKNGNGVRDADEAGVPNVTIYLDGGYTVETNASGEFMFNPVGSGEHRIGINVANVPLPWVLDEERLLSVRVQPRETALIEIPLISQRPEQQL